MDSGLLALTMLVAAVAGVVRGITGFGGALVMTPILSLYLAPALVVPMVLLLEAFAAGPMLRDAIRIANFPVIVPIWVAACLTVPLGVLLLAAAEPSVIRRAIAGIVIAFSLLLLRGVRYTGTRRVSTSIVIGAFCGMLLGATSIGMPPIIIYLLSGPDEARVTRANLTLCIVVISIAALSTLATRGILNLAAASTALILAPGFFLGVKFGVRLFPGFSESGFRQFTLGLLVAVSTVLLFV